MQRLIIFLAITLDLQTSLSENTRKEDSESDSLTTTPTNILKFEETFTKCYDELGCIDFEETWYHKKIRPINLKPFDRIIIKTEFVLIRKKRTQENRNEIFYQVVTPNEKSLQSAGYSKGMFLFMLIHDFTSNGYTGWVKHITRVLKSRTVKCNIISVDWHPGSEPPYDQAIANSRVVALEIINFLKFLKVNGELSLEQVHLIGHGIGAHIAGYVGRILKVKKITGLDPSGPRFNGMPAHVRLDATDADYVEVLHTDAMESKSQGAKSIFGHTDFFINNAEIQPGCSTKQFDVLSVTQSSLNKGKIISGCSHKRSFKYYIESLEIEDCTFLGIKCDSYLEFKQGKCTSCGEDCRTFGLVTYSKWNNGSYFLQTNSKRPYCLFQYRVNVHITGSKSYYLGAFKFFLIDENHHTTKSSMLEPREFKPGPDNSFVFYAGTPEMGKIVDAKVGWKEKSNKICLINCKQAINVERITIQSINSNTIYS